MHEGPPGGGPCDTIQRLQSDKIRVRSVSLDVKGQSIGFTKHVEQSLAPGIVARRQSGNRTERDGDRAARAFRPVRHRESGNEAPDVLPALAEQLERGCAECREWDVEVAGHQLTGDIIA